MSTVWWAGVAIDPATQNPQIADALNLHLDVLLGDADGGEHFATISERDGSQTQRYRFGMLVITDIIDRFGRRVGCGIEACDQHDAELNLDRIRHFLDAWGIASLVSVWYWGRMTAPAVAPVEVAARGGVSCP